jgi:hypothetical protein
MGVFPYVILLRDFSVKVAKNLREIRKKIGLIAPSFDPIVSLAILIRKPQNLFRENVSTN